MLGGLTACLITSLEGGPIEALANEVVVGNKKVENSSSPEEQSEFAKVFAALRGGGRVD